MAASVVGCDFVGCCWVLGDVVVAWMLWAVGHMGCGFLCQLMLGYGFFIGLLNGGGLLGVSLVNGCGGRWRVFF